MITLIFVALCCLSMFGLIFIATTILYSKKLNTHPQPMIAYICIAEACMSWNALIQVLNPVYVICYLNSFKILGYTLFKTSPGDWQDLANAQCMGNMIFYSYFQLISLTLNLCLCVDLILTIYDPFSPAYRRTKFYYIFCGTASFLLVMVIFGIGAKQDN